jgi:hypothetical protein
VSDPLKLFEDILKNGYHCVPIGSKRESDQNALEWRLSFSQAEQKLVYSMNHTQFLVYGLLKIFLKEIINDGVNEPLLCSYFLKTTLFWMIQEGSVTWRPSNLLNCFWKCLGYLYQCVYRAELPNFFIPQNNMFTNKVVGAARTALLEQLYYYNEMGVSCLLHSPTLRSILEPFPYWRFHVGHSVERYDGEVLCLDFIAGGELLVNVEYRHSELYHYFISLSTIDNLSRLSLSPYQSLTLQNFTAEILVSTAFLIANSVSNNSTKGLYKLDRIVCNMLKLASRVGYVSRSLYRALYY